jgi:bifunctional UDP-N-acetylglucosamine pyrophosphorylase/glucosamine-1-phosphate N-acetyltransferase
MSVSSVVLAAGQGKRIKSKLPKVLHPIAGFPMVAHALAAVYPLGEALPVLVVGVGADLVRNTLGDSVRYVVQEQQLGTGHAVQQAQSLLEGESDLVTVTYADMPLLRPETLQRMVAHHLASRSVVTILTIAPDEPRGFGRVVRDEMGHVVGVVEEPDATSEQLAIRELNAGVYCFDATWLWSHLDGIAVSKKGEYYLTDLVGMAVAEGSRVEAVTTDDPTEALGVNTRVHLAEAHVAMRQRINEKWMLEGVTLVDPAATYIGVQVRLGPDTVIHPNTFLEGQTVVGAECQLGPNTIIRDSILGNRCVVHSSVIEASVLEDDVDVGPFGHLRRGAHLASGVHMGNFGEVKDSYLGPGTKMGHFSYVGDTQTGPNVNIGAGAITCNYDGEQKHRTIVDEGAFIGSDTMLVAPVRIGKGAKTGAGSVVTHDVPPGRLAFGVPARLRPEPSGESSPADCAEGE